MNEVKFDDYRYRGKRIFYARHCRWFCQKKLGDALGMPFGEIDRIEKGKPMPDEFYKKVAQVLNVDERYIFNGEYPPDQIPKPESHKRKNVKQTNVLNTGKYVERRNKMGRRKKDRKVSREIANKVARLYYGSTKRKPISLAKAHEELELEGVVSKAYVYRTLVMVIGIPSRPKGTRTPEFDAELRDEGLALIKEFYDELEAEPEEETTEEESTEEESTEEAASEETVF